MNKAFVVFIILIVIAVGLVVFFSSRPEKANAQLDAFAKCLAQKGVTMYGAYWCSHCQNQKAAFGISFKYVPYVECTEESQKCLTEKIDGYPTWIFAGGERLVGEQSLAALASQSSCELKTNN